MAAELGAGGSRSADGPGTIVVRHGTVLPMDTQRTFLTDADVSIIGNQVVAVGTALEASSSRSSGDLAQRRAEVR